MNVSQRLATMTLSQLGYLVAVERHRSFREAASRCFVTQPALSQQILKLEEQLGVRVFDRSKQPVVPTEPGLRILAQARVILREAARMADVVAELSVDDWATQLQVNLVAPAALTRVALPVLRAARGTVVLVNSGAGLFAHPGWSAYAASKHGLRALADALRAEEPDLRVTTVYPGRTATAMQEKVHRQEGKEYDAADWIRPETVADAILHVLDLPRDATISDLTVRPGG